MIQKSEQLIPITRPFMPKSDRFMAYANKLWDTRWLTHGGPLVCQLQEELSQALKTAHTVVFANGHLALDCAMKALGISDGEAITTPFTYISTSHALSMNGLKPVFCDIKESDCTLDEEKIEELISEHTKVIVPVHVYGFPCNHQRIQEIADRHGLKVVYDAAHAFGVSVNGVGIGTMGNASMFSFHATKVFHTVEGGAIAFQDSTLTDRLVQAKNFGMIAPEEADSISFNAKMTEMHAAMGLANLETLAWQIERRKSLIEHYLERLSKIDEICLFHWNRKDIAYNYAYFPILFKKIKPGIGRDIIAQKLLSDYNIQARKYFYPLLSDLICYRGENDSATTPIAKEISNRVLTLPLFVELTHGQVDYICNAIEEILAVC